MKIVYFFYWSREHCCTSSDKNCIGTLRDECSLMMVRYYYGKILNSKEANQNFDLLMKNILWQNDEVIIFGKHIITKRKAAWYGDSDYLYTYSNSTKQALPWTEELSWLRQIVEELVGAKFNSCLLNLHHNAAIRSCRPNEIIKLKLKIFISKLVEITNTLKFY